MSLTLELTPEVEAALSRQAAAQGMSLDAFAIKLLQDAVPRATGTGLLTESELDQFFRDMSQYSDKIPVLPDEALSRESIYQDHD